ncbi:C40 family peptidase [Sporolactobacillus sp. Y61]|jgi:hypothetical protein|uniref:C40 family peptidase n=1 Tax=Sporolactobacillus sp. Y61 TaxID=3160863 RepID=A0AAU8ID64_9BACL|nr:C40 family peptidase [Sporolactobacillus sp. THM19-2]RYL92181.1 NlpC/P60 family protein [Sporolactobacillus sp. THM19-2]
MGRKWVSVPVATVWTNPGSVRPVDQHAFSDIPDLSAWLRQMTNEEKIALCREKRLQSQVLFGDEVIIDETHGDWVKVVVPSQSSAKDKRGYPGWMRRAHIADTRYDPAGMERVMVQSKFARLYRKRGEPVFELSFGTCLPLVSEDDRVVKVLSPAGEGYIHRNAVAFPARRAPLTGHEIVKNAFRFMDLPYLWSGMSAYGYDCSGFSYSMLRAAGYLIPRDADDQSRYGLPIPEDDMLPGDLLFFAYEEGKGYVHHVGIYAGDGKMIHSPTPGKIVSLTTLSGTLLEKELCAVRRYWKE